MAKKRPSTQKREREQKKRDRRLQKAASKAERRAATLSNEPENNPAGGMPGKDVQPC